ncbi:hypothetical protein [Enterobacter hormaechei]|uniref:hypothetical protein n=1 Tax=Enterobacter hormaechei TaxID=158836 RepID=UPI0022F02C9B|nr:hypothetical protein [Enterobacter hormaechei]MDA4644565.1 hypothetical protein [Enterobacter hormaechei]MDA4842159.1 hypothetical protein [Enterobacter hormaechei]
MSDKQQILTAEQQDVVFRTKADVLAELIKSNLGFQTKQKRSSWRKWLTPHSKN